MRESPRTILRRIPGVRAAHRELARARCGLAVPDELSLLIRDDRAVVLHPLLGIETDRVARSCVGRDVARDLIDVHGTARTPRKLIHGHAVPEGAALLRQPLALLKLPSAHEEYLKLVGSKCRNRIRKAEREGYKFKEFIWNDHLGDICEVNQSKECRQGGPMHGWYARPVEPRYCTENEECYRKYYGLFRDGKLRAYCHVVLCGDFAFFRHCIGHARDLPCGVMNGLLSGMVHEYAGSPEILWFSYGTLHASCAPLESFAKHVGCEPFAVVLDLANDDELQEYARRRRWQP